MTRPSERFRTLNCYLYCGDCIRACPTDSWQEEVKGWMVRVGGRHGRHPIAGHKIAEFISDEDVYLPLGAACFEIEHLPLEYLKGILIDLERIGFSIERGK